MTWHGELTKGVMKSRQVTKLVTSVYDSGRKKNAGKDKN